MLVMIWPLITDYGRYEFQELHRWVGEQARANGFEVIDVLSEFSGVWYRELQASAEDNVEDSTYQRRSPVPVDGVHLFLRLPTKPRCALARDNFLKVLMLEAEIKKSHSSSRTSIPIERPVHREFRAVRRFAGKRSLQILTKPAFQPMIPDEAADCAMSTQTPWATA